MPVAGLSPTEWSQATAADLRRFLVQQIEAHAERKLDTAQMFSASSRSLTGGFTECHLFKRSFSS